MKDNIFTLIILFFMFIAGFGMCYSIDFRINRLNQTVADIQKEQVYRAEKDDPYGIDNPGYAIEFIEEANHENCDCLKCHDRRGR